MPFGALSRSRAVTRVEAHADRPSGDRQLLCAPVRGERPSETVDVDAGHQEVGVLRLEAEQPVADGAADDVCVQVERSHVVLDGAHVKPLTPLDAIGARSLRSRRAPPTAASRPRRSSAQAASRRHASRTPRSFRGSRRGSAGTRVVLTSLSSDEPAASRIARRFAKTCSVCAPMSPGASSLCAREERQLAGDEDEPVRLDRLGVRRALERRGCCIGADGLLAHGSSFASGTGRHAGPSAAPTDLKIAARTCCGSVPSTSRTCRFSPAA